LTFIIARTWASRTFHSWAAVDATLDGDGGLSLLESVNKSGIPSTSRICAYCSPGQWARVELCMYGLTIFALLTGWPMIRQEEAELESRFGDEYRA